MGTASLKVWFWDSKGYCALSKEDLLWIGPWLFNSRMTVEQQMLGGQGHDMLCRFRKSCVSSTATSGLPRSRWSGEDRGVLKGWG